MFKTTKIKVFAYILNGSHLLVFKQPKYPEAGIQVPAGTVEKNESLEQALKREVIEETSIRNFEVISYLGSQAKDMSEFKKNEIHYRHFFLINTKEKTNQTWENIEKFNSDTNEDVMFSFYWVDLKSSIPKLIADHDIKLDVVMNFILKR